MVLSPIDPVAPRTVTARSADAAALLLRKGTALMYSPNHKTAADAIHAAPQKAKNSGHHDRGDEAVETIHQPAMPGNQPAGVLNTEPPLHRGLEEIAELRNNRKHGADQQNRPQFERQRRLHFAEANHDEPRGNHKTRRKAADRPRPGFLRTDSWPE